MRGCRYLFLALYVVLNDGCALAGPASVGERNGEMQKISPELSALYREYSVYIASGKGGKFQSRNPLVRVIDSLVAVDATASGDAHILKVDLEALGMQQAVAFGRIVSGQLPIAAIPRLEELSSLNFARAAAALLHGVPQPFAPGKSGR
jgi:hypothetical protein